MRSVAMDRTAMLRDLLKRPGILVTPGAYDCLSARLIELAGFEMVAVSGAGLTASLLGTPDLGLLTMTEVADQLRRIVDSVDVPVFADGESGFGGVLNVMRTVRSLESAGVAGLFLEDQTENRRCGHFSGKGVVSTETMVAKIRAAIKARQNPEFLIMARTDARGSEGLSAAIARARAYAEAGAESLFVEAPESTDELIEVAESLADLGLPLQANMAEGGRTPLHSAAELESMGYKFAHFPGSCQKVALKAMASFLADLRRQGSIGEYYPSKMATLDERSQILGLDRYLAVERALSEVPTTSLATRRVGDAGG
jgi:2-methylisocitrate lyase-like PEP mutase family enzyme